MTKGHCRFTIFDSRNGEQLGTFRSREGFTVVTVEEIREAIKCPDGEDLRVVRVEWPDYDEVALTVDRGGPRAPEELQVWDARSGERMGPPEGYARVDTPVLRELFAGHGRGLRIVSVEMGERGEVKVWAKGRKASAKAQ